VAKSLNHGFVSHSSDSLNNKPMFLPFTCSRITGTIRRMRQQTTAITYEKSQATSAHIDLTNTQKVRQIHQHKIFNVNLPVKLFPQEALQETEDSHKSLDACKSNGTQTKRHILDCVFSPWAYLH
jgi:hypothetical protein